jgi:hypothetical protein
MCQVAVGPGAVYDTDRLLKLEERLARASHDD